MGELLVTLCLYSLFSSNKIASFIPKKNFHFLKDVKSPYIFSKNLRRMDRVRYMGKQFKEYQKVEIQGFNTYLNIK